MRHRSLGHRHPLGDGRPHGGERRRPRTPPPAGRGIDELATGRRRGGSGRRGSRSATAGAGGRRGPRGLHVAADDAAARARCPGRARRSTPDWAATFRASGEAFTRSPEGAGAAAGARRRASGRRPRRGHHRHVSVAGRGVAVRSRACGAAGSGRARERAAGGAERRGSGAAGSGRRGRRARPAREPRTARSRCPPPAPRSRRSARRRAPRRPASTTILRSTPRAERLDLDVGLVGLDLGDDVAALDGSPSFFSHWMTLPVSMASESLGMTTLVITRCTPCGSPRRSWPSTAS